MDNNAGLENVKKMYEKVNYFDQYGGSVVLFIIITIILILLISYCLIMINSQPIIDDWVNQRCKPNIIPFAGLITHPEGVSASEYTQQNFNFCTQNILSSITGTALEPLTFVINTLNNVANKIKTDLQSVRGMFDKVRNMSSDVFQEIMGRIINITIPLQQMVIGFKDLMGKIQGSLTAGLFTLLGSYYTLKSLLGTIAQFIITILITLAVMIVSFWIVPFTWGAAISSTVIFIAIAIPMAIMLAFMVDVLKVQTNLKVPKVKCFDKDTILKMNDGTNKKIIDIKNGDILNDNNEVTAIIKVEACGSIMYKLNDNIIVSNSHMVKYLGKWMPTSEHPNAIKIESYNEPYLYCLNTTNKTINIDNYIFSDWDEIFGNELSEIMSTSDLNNLNDIHKYLDGGFKDTTKIKLLNGESKEIKNINVNDMLENGEKVYGIVKINGSNVNEQFTFNLGENCLIEGGPNLVLCDQNMINFDTTLTLDNDYKTTLDKNHNELYHLLTDKEIFYIEGIRFHDYNACIDLFLEKNRGKLLSMKYV
jgi:hypothetical protein